MSHLTPHLYAPASNQSPQVLQALCRQGRLLVGQRGEGKVSTVWVLAGYGVGQGPAPRCPHSLGKKKPKDSESDPALTRDLRHLPGKKDCSRDRPCHRQGNLYGFPLSRLWRTRDRAPVLRPTHPSCSGLVSYLLSADLFCEGLLFLGIPTPSRSCSASSTTTTTTS